MAVRSLAQSTLLQNPSVNSMLAGYSFQDFHHLETVQLGGNAASVTFSNLLQYSGEFRHLQVRATVRTNRASTVDSVQIRFNNISTNSYSVHVLRGLNTSLISYAEPSSNRIQFLTASGASAPSGIFGGGFGDILDAFDTSKNTTVRILSGWNEPTENTIYLASGALLDTAAITSVQLFSQAGASMISGSRFSLYGVR